MTSRLPPEIGFADIAPLWVSFTPNKEIRGYCLDKPENTDDIPFRVSAAFDFDSNVHLPTWIRPARMDPRNLRCPL